MNSVSPFHYLFLPFHLIRYFYLSISSFCLRWLSFSPPFFLPDVLPSLPLSLVPRFCHLVIRWTRAAVRNQLIIWINCENIAHLVEERWRKAYDASRVGCEANFWLDVADPRRRNYVRCEFSIWNILRKLYAADSMCETWRARTRATSAPSKTNCLPHAENKTSELGSNHLSGFAERPAAYAARTTTTTTTITTRTIPCYSVNLRSFIT